MQTRGQHARRHDDRQQCSEPRLDPASQRVGHASPSAGAAWATYVERRASVSAAGKAHCAGAPASASVRVSSRQGRHRRIRPDHDPRIDRLEPVVIHQAREQRIVLEPAQEPGRADHLLAPVQRGLDTEAPLGCRSRERLVPGRRPADTTGRAVRAAAPPARRRRAGGTRRGRGGRSTRGARSAPTGPARAAEPRRPRRPPRARSATPSPPPARRRSPSRVARTRAARRRARPAGRRAAPPGRSGRAAPARAARDGRHHDRRARTRRRPRGHARSGRRGGSAPSRCAPAARSTCERNSSSVGW